VTGTVSARLPKGFRDTLPAEMIRRQYVLDIVTDTFHRYGFEPLETPVIELNETLYGKLGEDAENLIFGVRHARSEKDELSLRYDLTVPLARVVAQYRNEVHLPFKRYQIAPVFRGERPQRGRYRQFTQCDADIAGSSSMAADAELVSLKVTILERLGLPDFVVRINNRKLLTAMGIYAGLVPAQLADLYRSIDKFDKIGEAGVRGELAARGIAEDVVTRMMALVTAQYPGTANLDFVEAEMGHLPEARAAIAELRAMHDAMGALGVPPGRYTFDFSMVRGLGYYTGPIYETTITEPNLGSISGGGRYDGLIGIFRGEEVPTTGTSLGIERIIDVMAILDLYPNGLGTTVVGVYVTVFAADLEAASAAATARLRSAGIATEMDLSGRKLARQIQHANRKGVPVVAVLGPDEAAAGMITLKRMADGHSELVPLAGAADVVRGWGYA
jgi:histidyl-tRNA synthetase